MDGWSKSVANGMHGGSQFGADAMDAEQYLGVDEMYWGFLLGAHGGLGADAMDGGSQLE